MWHCRCRIAERFEALPTRRRTGSAPRRPGGVMWSIRVAY
jgi:hypothetical protein